MIEANYEYYCVCGLRAPLSSASVAPVTCPLCGEQIAISVISSEEPQPGDPSVIPEMVFTTKQIAYKWPRGFWHRIGERLKRGEIVINPRTMGEILQRVAQPPLQRPRQKPGPVLVASAEEFQQVLRDNLAQFKNTRLWPLGNGALIDQARAGQCWAAIP